MMKIDPEFLKTLKLHSFDADFVDTVSNQYGGGTTSLAEALTNAKGVRKGKKTGLMAVHRSYFSRSRNGTLNNPTKKTMEAFADVMDVAIVILPKRFREALDNGDADS